MRKLVYLISPNKINNDFYDHLTKVLSKKNVKFFQLRLKKVKKSKIIKIAKEIRKITKKHKVKLIINDHPNISKITNADGCHLGQKDGSAKKAKKQLKNKILSVSYGNLDNILNKIAKEIKSNKYSHSHILFSLHEKLFHLLNIYFHLI